MNITRVLSTNQFVGTVRTDFVTQPVFLPPPVPPELPLPPVIGPRSVSVAAVDISAPALNLDGTLSGTALGADPTLVLNGGATYAIDWNVGPATGVLCVDVNACP